MVFCSAPMTFQMKFINTVKSPRKKTTQIFLPVELQHYPYFMLHTVETRHGNTRSDHISLIIIRLSVCQIKFTYDDKSIVIWYLHWPHNLFRSVVWMCWCKCKGEFYKYMVCVAMNNSINDLVSPFLTVTLF
jgi:hypothetical protein